MSSSDAAVAPVLHALRARRRFVLASHARPDGDALGSLLGLRLILQEMGKEADVLVPGGVPPLYRYLPGSAAVTATSQVPAGGSWDAAILLECSSFTRTHITGWEGLYSINVDHHYTGRPFADVNWIDAEACAAAEMVYQLACAAEVQLTREIATCLYTGILADTGSFSFPNTSAHALSVAAELARLGADPHQIACTMYLSYPEAKMRVLAAALQNLRIEKPLAWMYVTGADLERNHAREEDAEGLVNYALGMDGVEVAAFFRPVAGGYRVSLRAKHGYEVSDIAESFGGGGHRQASGFSQAGSLESVMARVLPLLRAALGMRPQPQPGEAGPAQKLKPGEPSVPATTGPRPFAD